jgi:hypothetical protein
MRTIDQTWVADYLARGGRLASEPFESPFASAFQDCIDHARVQPDSSGSRAATLLAARILIHPRRRNLCVIKVRQDDESMSPKNPIHFLRPPPGPSGPPKIRPVNMVNEGLGLFLGCSGTNGSHPNTLI